MASNVEQRPGRVSMGDPLCRKAAEPRIEGRPGRGALVASWERLGELNGVAHVA